MLESDLKQWTLDKLKGCNIKIQAIESPSTGAGIPDWWYGTFTGEGWIEFKWLGKIGLHIKIPFEPGQYSWLCNYAKLRGNAFLFAGFIDSFGRESLCVLKRAQILREYEILQFCRENTLCKPLDEITQTMVYSILQGEYDKCSG